MSNEYQDWLRDEEEAKEIRMRNPNRIKEFLSEIQTEWEKVPGWRFGQLMASFLEDEDPFFWEEDEFLEKFRQFMGTVA